MPTMQPTQACECSAVSTAAQIVETPIEEVIHRKKKIDLAAYKLANMLAT